MITNQSATQLSNQLSNQHSKQYIDNPSHCYYVNYQYNKIIVRLEQPLT